MEQSYYEDMHEMSPSNPAIIVQTSSASTLPHYLLRSLVLSCLKLDLPASPGKNHLTCFVKSVPYLVLDEKHLPQFMILFMFPNKT